MLKESFKKLAIGGGEAPFAKLLYWLQEYSACLSSGWQDLEPAMLVLIGLISPEDDRATVDVLGDDWKLTAGPVDLAGEIGSIQRQQVLLAAVRPDREGRLVAAAYRPLDASSAAILTSCSHLPGPDGKVSLREHNWELWKDTSASNGQFYAWQRGESYVSYWNDGLGILPDGVKDLDWAKQAEQEPFKPALTAVQLGAWYMEAHD